MDEGFSFREAATWAISGLAVAVSALSRKIWTGHESRMDDLEARHDQHAHDLTAHAVGDAASHDKIKQDLASAIDRLNHRIDEKTDALSTQISTQHNALSNQLINVITLIKGGK